MVSCRREQVIEPFPAILPLEVIMGDVRTTMIYTHTVPSRTQKERASPLDLGGRVMPV